MRYDTHTSMETRDAAMVGLRKVKGLLYLLTHLSPRMCLDLGELELGVVGVHLPDLLSGWGAENLERNRTEKTQSYNLPFFGLFNNDIETIKLTLIISTN